MIYELLHAPFEDGYTEALLPLDQCRQHLSIETDDDDMLIEVLRDAAVEFVERHCAVKLGPVTGLVWRGESFPASTSRALWLGVWKEVRAVTAISWFDREGVAVVGDPADFRVSAGGDLLPAIGKAWPTDVGGGVAITFDAGYLDGAAPAALLSAARMFLGHLYRNREAIVCGSSIAETPFGVDVLCGPFRRVSI